MNSWMLANEFCINDKIFLSLIHIQYGNTLKLVKKYLIFVYLARWNFCYFSFSWNMIFFAKTLHTAVMRFFINEKKRISNFLYKFPSSVSTHLTKKILESFLLKNVRVWMGWNVPMHVVKPQHLYWNQRFLFLSNLWN